MKKSLVALSVLAASGAVMAQSSVSLYGIADAFVGSRQTTGISLSGGNLLTLEQRQSVLDSGGLNGSRWGLKGTEDLGGGLKANFVLESGFDISNGASTSSGVLFDRQAVVGLSGNFGAVSLGRQYGAYDNVRGAFLSAQGNSPAFDATNGVPLTQTLAIYAVKGAFTFPPGSSVANDINTAAVGGRIGAWAGYQARINNSIRYETPNISGFQAAVVYGFGEDKNTPPNTAATQNASFSLTYVNGPLALGLAHQDDELVRDFHLKNTAIGGNYDLGLAKIFLAYNQAKYTGLAKQNEWSVGVRAPLGATTLVAQYARSNGDDLGKSQSLGLSAEYSLSKRTTAYAAFNQTNAYQNLVKNNVYGLGVRHTF
ncbi:MAG: porin [Polaromonas sp.]|nr:porin [Polaromonas sp.]